MYYTIRGSGKPLVLIHGWAMHAGVWGNFVRTFSRRNTVIAVDLRGHGKSAGMGGPYDFDTFARDMATLIAELNLDRITLVGWSMGVSIILKMLAQRSFAAVDSLVFISGNPSLVQRGDYAHGLADTQVKRLARQIDRDFSLGLESFYSLLCTPQERIDLQQSNLYGILTDREAAPSQEAAAAALHCLRCEDLRSTLGAVRVPTLLVHGSEDRICMPEASRHMHTRLAGSVLLMLDKTGHVPFMTRPHDVHKALATFLDSLP